MRKLSKIVEDLFVDDAVDMIGRIAGNGGKESDAGSDSGDEKTDQSVPAIPGEQCRKHYDGRVHRFKKIHECRAGICLYSRPWC